MKTVCTHIWMLDPPEGPTSPGVCKLCSKTEVFPNALPEAEWGGHLGGRVSTNQQGGRESTPAAELAGAIH